MDLPLSFLSLPYKIRKRIYAFAGLMRDCPITIAHPPRVTFPPAPVFTPPPGFPPPGFPPPGFSPAPPLVPPVAIQPVVFRPLPGHECRFALLQRDQDRAVYASYPECVCPEIPKRLLRVSKAIHAEVSGILYGENKFVIRAHTDEDLEVFSMLSDTAVSHLRCLMIRLNAWPCHRGHSSLMPVVPSKCPTCTASIRMSDPELIGGRGQPETLIRRWDILCSRLASCISPGHLELEFVCDVGDLATARRVVKPLTSLPHLKRCTIRLGRQRDHALENLARSTSLRLTTQYNHGEESGSSVFPFFRLPQEIRRNILMFTNLEPGNVNGERRQGITIKVGNWDASNDPYSVVPLRTCCYHCSFTKRDCSCSSDYASFSSTCQCRVLPLDLFLVSRQMYLEAAEVLYSRNTFTFVGPFKDTLRCLQTLRPGTLNSFRRIRFFFDVDQSLRYCNHEEAWACLLSFIAENFDLSRLLVIIDTSKDTQQCMYNDYEEWFLHDLYKTYISVVKRVKSMLPGLQGFHIFLGAFFDLEPILERFVMGSEYDSRKTSRNQKANTSTDWSYLNERGGRGRGRGRGRGGGRGRGRGRGGQFLGRSRGAEGVRGTWPRAIYRIPPWHHDL